MNKNDEVQKGHEIASHFGDVHFSQPKTKQTAKPYDFPTINTSQRLRSNKFPAIMSQRQTMSQAEKWSILMNLHSSSLDPFSMSLDLEPNEKNEFPDINTLHRKREEQSRKRKMDNLNLLLNSTYSNNTTIRKGMKKTKQSFNSQWQRATTLYGIEETTKGAPRRRKEEDTKYPAAALSGDHILVSTSQCISSTDASCVEQQVRNGDWGCSMDSPTGTLDRQTRPPTQWLDRWNHWTDWAEGRCE